MSRGPLHAPVLETERLRVRPLEPRDLAACQDLFRDIGWADPARPAAEVDAERAAWLHWTMAGYRELDRLTQPPLIDRAVERRADGAFAGLVGLTPALGPFAEHPALGGSPAPADFDLEVGMFWAVSPAFQGQGYAAEAALALSGWAFAALRLGRIVATTERDNLASQGVMRRMGMAVWLRPHADLPWAGAIGVLRRP